jgi:hypothetical protein
VAEAPQQTQDREHQHRHAEALVAREHAEFVQAERQIGRSPAEHELSHDQSGDDPVKALRHRTVAAADLRFGIDTLRAQTAPPLV